MSCVKRNSISIFWKIEEHKLLFYIFFFYMELNCPDKLKFSHRQFSNRHPTVICIVVSRTPRITARWSLKKLIERDCRWWPTRDRLASSSKQAKRFLKRFIRSPVNRWSIYFRRSSCEQNIMGRDVCVLLRCKRDPQPVSLSLVWRETAFGRAIKASKSWQAPDDVDRLGFPSSQAPMSSFFHPGTSTSRPAKARFPFSLCGSAACPPSLTAHRIKLDRCPIYLLAPFF